MKKTLCSLITLVCAHSLLACSQYPTHRSKSVDTVVSSSHNIYIEGGVLKVLSGDEHNILFLYVRPEEMDNWVAAGGGGGSQTEPWLFKSAIVWAQGDGNGWHSNDAPQKTFNFQLDSHDMTLKTDKGTYAVRSGDFVVITLDKDWYPGTVNSGIESLRLLDLPDSDKQHLVNEARKHYTGL